MNLLAIDSGYAKSGKGCACAAFFGRHLVKHFFERPRECHPASYGMAFEIVLWEQPQGDGRTWHVPPEVMIQLTTAGAELAGLFAGWSMAHGSCCKIVSQTPTGSKGSVPKPIAHLRLWEALTEPERAMLGGAATGKAIAAACERGALDRWRPGKSYYPSTWLMHNILDAVALGAKYLGRL
jgi:hypothetical protein